MSDVTMPMWAFLTIETMFVGVISVSCCQARVIVDLVDYKLRAMALLKEYRQQHARKGCEWFAENDLRCASCQRYEELKASKTKPLPEESGS